MKTISILVLASTLSSCSYHAEQAPNNANAPLPEKWSTDFFDDFNHFDQNNWQDQMLWVNDERQCYLPDNQHNTREVSDGTLKNPGG